jgi:hypothetical protein
VLCNEVAEVLVIDGAPFCLDHVGYGWVAQARGRAIIGDRDPDDAERRVVEALRRARDAFQPGGRNLSVPTSPPRNGRCSFELEEWWFSERTSGDQTARGDDSPMAAR